MKERTFLLLAVAIVFAGCQFREPDYLKTISAAQLRELMQKEDIFLVDVHIPEQKHIKGTDLFVPYNDIDKHLSQLPSDKNTPIYLYCEGGPMGNAAARRLHELGYTNLTNLSGGEHAWLKAGYTLD